MYYHLLFSPNRRTIILKFSQLKLEHWNLCTFMKRRLSKSCLESIPSVTRKYSRRTRSKTTREKRMIKGKKRKLYSTNGGDYIEQFIQSNWNWIITSCIQFGQDWEEVEERSEVIILIFMCRLYLVLLVLKFGCHDFALTFSIFEKKKPPPIFLLPKPTGWIATAVMMFIIYVVSLKYIISEPHILSCHHFSSFNNSDFSL